MEVARISVTDAIEFIIISVSNANCICVDSEPIVKAENVRADITIWIVRFSISDEYNINAIGDWINTARLREHEITHTLSSTTGVGVPDSITIEVVGNICNSFRRSHTSTAGIIIAVEAELYVVLVIERHDCNFDWSAKEHHQLAELLRYQVEITLAYAA